jgi:hypothetical protein
LEGFHFGRIIGRKTQDRVGLRVAGYPYLAGWAGPISGVRTGLAIP